MHMTYLIGQPGSGKSTLSEALTAGLRIQTVKTPFAHRLVKGVRPVVELGAHRTGFSGTDALPMNVQPTVLRHLALTQWELVFGEGDRLANSKFFKGVLDLGYDLTIVRLAVSAPVAEARRAARAAELGANAQNLAWLKGRITKNARLAEEWADRLVVLDADQHPARVLASLLALNDPVVAALRSAV